MSNLIATDIRTRFRADDNQLGDAVANREIAYTLLGKDEEPSRMLTAQWG